MFHIITLRSVTPTLTHTNKPFTNRVARSFCDVICRRVGDVFIDRVLVLKKSRLMRWFAEDGLRLTLINLIN